MYTIEVGMELVPRNSKFDQIQPDTTSRMSCKVLGILNMNPNVETEKEILLETPDGNVRYGLNEVQEFMEPAG